MYGASDEGEATRTRIKCGERQTDRQGDACTLKMEGKAQGGNASSNVVGRPVEVSMWGIV